MGRILLAVLFLVAGSFHFVSPETYLAIMPPLLPAPRFLVALSGACEMLGGLGLLLPGSTRRIAAWGLVLLLFCVWPANVYMATIASRFPAVPEWTLWARIPLQIPMIWWAWRYTRR